ncbi:hypothetical protein LIER_05218 [Lithospermum erythrorhizon]|uniref:Uncharacterized protein n=1 Tax=Lithospermum erythrorhizon TaxID=34254 RepID=A0AAV3P1N0_LITER
MGDKATLEKARRELEELYLGIPDDSVNLTFQDLAQVQQKKIQQQHSLSLEKKTSPPLISNQNDSSSSSLNKLPSLDFNQSIEASRQHFNNDHIQYPNFHHHIPTDNHHNLHHMPGSTTMSNPSENHLHHHGHHQLGDHIHGHSGHHHGGHYTGHHHAELGHHGGVETSVSFSDMSGISMSSMMGGYNGKVERRRPGIPHSNICTICSTSVYIFRHRCLVCGRVYCKKCVRNGMGEMTEGRKCIECLGRRFSQRYIQKAGQMGCCMGYPNTVKQEELKWAERGPRRSREKRYGQSSIRPRSPSPMTPRSPSSQIHTAGNTPSFVMNSPYSPYSHTTFHMPL